MQVSTHPYQAVKHYLLQGIGAGRWTSGDQLPSENQLAETCHVSRMTARKALEELSKQGILLRIKGKGSFVTQEKQQFSMLQIKSIAAEIKQQGLEYRCQLLELAEVKAASHLAKRMNRGIGDSLFYSELLHFKQGQPIQLEQRWVTPHTAPHYLEQDFSKQTPGEYLTQIAPLTEAEHQIEAMIGSARIRQQLQLDEDEAIILLKRKTWCNQNLVSYAKLFHPGKRYRFGNKFKPNDSLLANQGDQNDDR